MHEQGTLDALLTHWVLAGTLIVSGLIALSTVLAREEAKALRMFGTLLLVDTALQLILFKEKPGAHAHAAPAAEAEHRGH